jgi:diguanylate cyclase (GGDEF)-like protein/PAS domain S-box-containing protein
MVIAKMRRVTNTKNKLLILTSLSLMILMLIIIGNTYIDEKSDLKLLEKDYREKTVRAYNRELNNYELLYKTRLEAIVSSEAVIDAIKKRDRQKLYKLVEPRWNILKKNNPDVSILHFHKADGHTLLRVHNPSLYDDNIALRRAMCRYMHEVKKPVLAYEAGVHLLGYRVMIPIFDAQEYLGALEIGIKPSFLLNKMRDNYGVYGAVFSKIEDIYKEDISKETIINGYKLQSSVLEDEDLIKYLPKDYNLDKDIRIEKDGRIYDIYMFEHSDFKGEVSVKALVFNDVTSIKEKFNKSIVQVIILFVVLYFIILLIVKYGFEKILSKIDKANKELLNSVALLESHQLALDESSIVTKSDLKGRMTYVNDNFCEITGYSKEEALGKPHSLVRHPDNPKEMFEELWDTIKSKKVWKGVLKNTGKNGDYWVDTSILPILDDDGEIVEYIAVRHDVTQMVLQQEKLDNIANTDTLTGLGSRYKLMGDILESTSPALSIINIDSFSEVNDFYGHEKGDYVIVKLSKMLSDMLKNTDLSVYHLQGDEFVIFSKDTKRKIFIENITDILKKISQQPIDIDGEELYISLSSSISFEEKTNILTTADMALKIAKKGNKDLVIYSDETSLNELYQNNIKWSKKIRTAIESDNIVPVFQPIVNNENSAYEKYESLVRLRDDDGKLISPFFFLDISKKTKHYNKITKIMIQKSFEMFKDKEYEFSINLTIEDILDKSINEFICEMLKRYKIGDRVVFEIVESESIENFEKILSFIEKIKSYDCKIAIDDFGTGYSNFEYLLKLKVDYIKIDGSMIKDIDTNEDAQLVVSTIVDFAKKMGVKTIAEFVENESILNKVKELGIDYSQGYHFSAPKLDL